MAPMVATTEEPLHVLDLPQLYTKPSYEALLDALNRLQVKPPSWTSNGVPAVSEDRAAIAFYLSKVVGSSLKWLEKEEHKEVVWELASKRLSERAGRSGMPAMTRTWSIPSRSGQPLPLALHEPPLTGDRVGFKTWASSFLLAKQLEAMKDAYLSHLRDSTSALEVLELGSGTGLVGLATAALWNCHVTLTDLPEIVPNLRVNVEANQEEVKKRGGHLRAEVLDWADPFSDLKDEKFDVILAADTLYSFEHASLLVKVVRDFLKPGSSSRAILELPLRDTATVQMREELRVRMAECGLELLHEGIEKGFDDWEENGHPAEVECWWGIWGWIC